MSDISVDVDLAHPPHRVWRALTDRRRLATWFMQTDLEPRVGAVGGASPGGIPGFTGPFDIEVTSVSPERLLVMQWRGDQLHAEVRWELEQVGDGTRLRIVQTGFFGVNGTLRRRELRRAYQRLFGEELPAMLARTAPSESRAATAGHDRAERPLTPPGAGVENELPSAAPRGLVDSAVGIPSDPWALNDPSVSVGVALPGMEVAEDASPPRVAAGRPARPAAKPVRVAVITVMVATIVATAGWLWLRRPVHEDPAGPISTAPQAAGVGALPQSPFVLPTVGPSHSTGPGGLLLPGGGVDPGASGRPSAQPSGESTQSGLPTAQPALTAKYSTQSSTSLLGYQVSVTVTVHNPGTSPHSGWTVVLTIPSGASIDSTSDSVQASKSEEKVTVTPKEANKVVNSGGDAVVVVTFSGNSLLGIGSGGVTGCTIDGADCARA